MQQDKIIKNDNDQGNYKGMMICSRPGEDLKDERIQPFITRVYPKEQLGMNPIKSKSLYQKFNINYPSHLEYQQRHKLWLQEFQAQSSLKLKKKNSNNEIFNAEKFKRIRDMAAIDRQKAKKMRKEYEKLKNQLIEQFNNNKNKKNDLEKLELNKENLQKLEERENFIDFSDIVNQYQVDHLEKLKKEKNFQQIYKEKPKWAYTQKQIDQIEDKELDELINFTEQLDYEKYMQDLEVQTQLKSIKERITQLIQKKLKEEEEKDNIEKNQNTMKPFNSNDNEDSQSLKIPQQNELEQNKDKKIYEKEYETQTQQTKFTVETNRTKLQQNELIHDQDWDCSTNLNKNSAKFEERIASKVADEILKTYKPLRDIHSKNSMKKILENEAQIQLIAEQFSIGAPIIAMCPNEHNKFDRYKQLNPSNLPYLHRNPAI